MSKISATIVADSVSPQGHRITTILGVIPRMVLSELNTHRMFSRNSASSRAVPFKRMVEMVKTDPFIPIAWQKEHTGMQGTEYITNIREITLLEHNHRSARDYAVQFATNMTELGATKQLANRYLEPFMWHTVLITATEWENFFELRCPQYDIGDGKFYATKKRAISAMKARGIDTEIGEVFTSDLEWLQINKGGAEIHISTFAECILDAMEESKPKELKEGEWHIPFEDKIMPNLVETAHYEINEYLPIKISTAMAARTSYTTVGDEKEISYEKLIGIHDRMAVQVPFHASPFEHCARAMTNNECWYWTRQHGKGLEGIEMKSLPPTHINEGWCRNFRGFIQYREIIENK